MDTPEELRISFALSFNKNSFNSLENGPSRVLHDGLDETFSVKTASGTVSVRNFM